MPSLRKDGLPRAPRGYRWESYGGEMRLMKVARPVESRRCPMSGRRVTNAVRALRKHACPECGQSIDWENTYLDSVLYWSEHDTLSKAQLEAWAASDMLELPHDVSHSHVSGHSRD